jgi:dolichol-phosphate mannosyltransferase
MRKVLIITPTYNEKENIGTLIDKIFDLQNRITNWEINLLVVDSHSPDQTAAKIKELQKKYKKLHLLETEKKGLGRAYVEGYRYAFGKINPYLIIQMDADLSHQPEYILNFLKEIEKGADFVLGSRYIKNGSIPKEWAWYRKLFSFFGNLIIRIGFANFKITDWTSGYRAIKSWVIKEIMNETKKYSGYVFQIATIDQALKKNARLVESPIKFIDRRHGKSKINFFQYIFNIIFYILSNSSFVKFVVVGTLGFIIDFGLSYILIEKIHLSIRIATIISTETAIISNFIFNNFWSFSHKKLNAGNGKFVMGLIKFNFVSMGSIIIQSEGINLLAYFFGKQWWYLYKIAIIVFVIIPYSFILYNKVIWKKN